VVQAGTCLLCCSLVGGEFSSPFSSLLQLVSD
jgi:hypothetical protein